MNRMDRVNRNVIAVCLTVLVLALLGLYGWTRTVGDDPAAIVRWIGSVGAQLTVTTSALIMAWRANVRTKIIQQQTNGHLSELIARTGPAAEPHDDDAALVTIGGHSDERINAADDDGDTDQP